MFFSKQEQSKLRDYLALHSKPVNLAQDSNDLSLFSHNESGPRLFLVGENHGIADNARLKLYLLKYLVRNANVKYFLLEAGYYDSLLFNRFLESGHIELLDEIFSSYQGYYSGMKEEYDFWKHLYEFNAALPAERKIKVFGIDSISGVRKSLDYIAGLVRECGDPPEDIKNVIDCVVQLESIYREEHISTERNIAGIWITFMSSLMTFREQYAGYLGVHFSDFVKVSDDMFTRIKRRMSVTKSREIREKYMFTRANEEIRANDSRYNYFGQFGNSHVGSPFTIIEPFGNRLNDSDLSPVRNSVVRICCIYNNCDGLLESGSRFIIKKISYPVPLQELFEGIFPDRVTVVKLDHEGSPFTILSGKEDAFLRDFHPSNIQYFIVINGSAASHPL